MLTQETATVIVGNLFRSWFLITENSIFGCKQQAKKEYRRQNELTLKMPKIFKFALNRFNPLRDNVTHVLHDC